MFAFIVRRTLWIIPVLLTVATVTFFLMHNAPGGPWDQDKPLPPASTALLNRKFGLDKPLWFNSESLQEAREAGESSPFGLARAYLDSQYFNYIFGVARGDLGPSYQSRGSTNVQDVILQRFPTSAKLGLVAATFALLVGVLLGVTAALKQNTWIDYICLFIATVGISIPSFVTAVLVVILLSTTLGIPPIRRPQEWVGLGTAYLVPGIVLGLGTMSYITRLTRSSVLEIKRQDYVRTARAKGLSEGRVVLRHMLRNSMIPVVTILGPAIAALVTGSFIIEPIFGIPGMGTEFVTSIARRDYSMIMGTTLFYALLVALANLSVDLSYGVLDPRIRSGR